MNSYENREPEPKTFFIKKWEMENMKTEEKLAWAQARVKILGDVENIHGIIDAPLPWNTWIGTW